MCLSTDRYQMIKYPNPWTAIHHWKLVLSFNRVRHKGLLLKIQDLGARGNLYKVIESFHCNRYQKVIYRFMGRPKVVSNTHRTEL